MRREPAVARVAREFRSTLLDPVRGVDWAGGPREGGPSPTSIVPGLVSGLHESLRRRMPGRTLRSRTMALHVELNYETWPGASEHGGLRTSIQAERM